MDGKRGDNVWYMDEYIVWGESNSEVLPKMLHPSVHHVNSLHVTLGTCQALTQPDWLSSPHFGKQFAGYRWELLPNRMEIVEKESSNSTRNLLKQSYQQERMTQLVIGKSM